VKAHLRKRAISDEDNILTSDKDLDPDLRIELQRCEQGRTISDNGPGIPASVRRTLFDPFVSAGKPSGTGLGITLAPRIAKEHNGSVWLVGTESRENTIRVESDEEQIFAFRRPKEW
jgi:nitrogen-specific signal transduction histidine kinase